MAKYVVLIVLVMTRVALADGDGAVRSRNTALGLAIGGSIVSIGMFAIGAVAADTNDPHSGRIAMAASILPPSLGEWYGGKYLTLGLGLRAAGMATMAVGIAFLTCVDGACNSNLPLALVAVGASAIVAGYVYDIATARCTVDAFNARHRRVGLAPTVITRPSGPVMGLGLAGAF